MKKRHIIQLTEAERKTLLSIVRKGKNKASVIQRAHILLKSDEGKTDSEISQLLYISEQTVRRTRLRYCEERLANGLNNKPRPQIETKIDEKQTAYLVALACSTAPSGRSRWTMELLAEQLVKDGVIETVSAETVRLTLKKTS